MIINTYSRLWEGVLGIAERLQLAQPVDLWSELSRGAAAFVLLAAVLSVLAYGIALRYWGVPESFAPFAVFGALALYWACAEAKWKWLAPGACAGLAHLSRADGLNDVLTWERGRQVTRQQGLHSLAWEDELT